MHLSSTDIAAYVDGRLPSSDRSRVEAHLGACDVCRGEVIEVARLLRTRPRNRRWYVPIGAAAAAAGVLLLVWPRPNEQPTYREPAVTTVAAPVVIAPRGVISGARRLVWTGVAHADRYRLVVFDTTGQAVWETQTTDTSTLIPQGLRLHHGASYFWKVEAQAGWDRWVASELVEFSLPPDR